MWESLKLKVSNAWQGIKDWFKRSETIFLARMEVVTGLVITAVSAIDWSPLWSTVGTGTAFNWKQGVTIGAMLTFKGLLSEWARRRNDPALSTNPTPPTTPTT